MAHNTPYTPEVLGDLLVQEPNPPAAGADYSATVPAGEQWLLHSVGFRLTCDANVANRFPGIFVKPASGRVISQSEQLVIQTATQIVTWTFVNQGQVTPGPGSVNNKANGVVGNLFLQPASILLIHITGIQVGDQVDLIVYEYQKFLVKP